MESEMELAYKRTDYKSVTALHFDRPFTIKEHFLRGLSFAETGDNANAILSFEKVIEDNTVARTSDFKDEAQFYLALAYVRN